MPQSEFLVVSIFFDRFLHFLTEIIVFPNDWILANDEQIDEDDQDCQAVRSAYLNLTEQSTSASDTDQPPSEESGADADKDVDEYCEPVDKRQSLVDEVVLPMLPYTIRRCTATTSTYLFFRHLFDARKYCCTSKKTFLQLSLFAFF